MQPLNGVLILAAVVLILAYLIARPHIGTVYVEYTYETHNYLPDLKTLRPVDRYLSRAECDQEASKAMDAALLVDAASSSLDACKPSTELLWGW
jgi:hypothetical protein